MKRILALFLFLTSLSFAVLAEPKWYGTCIPPDNIADASTVYKIFSADGKTIKIKVGQNVPPGLYGIAPMQFADGSIVHTQYLLTIMRGMDVICNSELLDTESHYALNLIDGDFILFGLMDTLNAIYLYSIDTPVLRLY